MARAQPSEPAPAEPPPAEPAPEPAPPPPEPGPAPAPAPAAPAPAPPPAPAAAPQDTTHENGTKPPDQSVDTSDVVSLGNDKGFRFGSYGRIIAGTDLRGGKPEEISVVAHPPRIVEDSYLELDSSYGFVTPSGAKLRPVVTLAFDGTLFHDTGVFDATPALRNLFLDAVVNDHLTLWVGSRMYRGDDIYLFDFWPLDNLNTVGGGMFYRVGALEVAVHAGENRLMLPCTDGAGCQYQETDVANPAQGATTIVQLNRERMIASATASYLIDHGPAALDIKLKLHAQIHGIGSGDYKRDDGTFEHLPADQGALIGGEVSLFGLAPGSLGYRRHLNLFVRYAKGLAAFDPLSIPTSFGTDLKTTNASELLLGASGNWDAPYGNMMFGVLSRRFIGATGATDDPNSGWEYSLDARPLARAMRDVFVGADISYQARFPDGLNPITLRAEDPAVFQIAPMVVYSPMGPSAYDRPQIRAVFRAAHLNDGALDLYVPDDPRHAHDWVYFLGLEAEWWFNSSSYR
ncbi:MAG TPA: carbohydrate porin [Kofleriaceae bacterium]|nr:carbohydrate porin [Kofleriaceae bacterium]